MDLIHSAIDFVLHIDQHLAEIVNNYQTWTYLILFLIVFAETGLVVTPILPGDSLLFAAGAIIAKPETELSLLLLWILLIAAAILGDMANYYAGKYVGARAFSGRYKFFKYEYLSRTQQFYQKYGGKTVIYARFIPIIRTFAPFVAGIGTMSYGRFVVYNIAGALLWVSSFLLLGYYFGGLPIIKNNFTYVVFAIIIASVLPPVVQIAREKILKKKRLEKVGS